MTYSTNSSLHCQSSMRVYESTTMHACGAADAGAITHLRCRERASNCWIKSLFLCSLRTKIFWYLHKLRLNHWCHMDYLMMSLLPFWALNVSVVMLSMWGQKALRLLSGDVKIFSLNVGLFLTHMLSNDFRRLFLLKLETFSPHLLQLCGKEQPMQPSEHLPLCYTEEGKSNRFSMTWGWANATVCVQTGHEMRSEEVQRPSALLCFSASIPRPLQAAACF